MAHLNSSWPDISHRVYIHDLRFHSTFSPQPHILSFPPGPSHHAALTQETDAPSHGHAGARCPLPSPLPPPLPSRRPPPLPSHPGGPLSPLLAVMSLILSGTGGAASLPLSTTMEAAAWAMEAERIRLGAGGSGLPMASTSSQWRIRPVGEPPPSSPD